MEVLYFCQLNFQSRGVSKQIRATKGSELRDATCRATLFLCKFSSMFPVFHLARSTCRATKTFVTGF